MKHSSKSKTKLRPKTSYRFEAIGTGWIIELDQALSAERSVHLRTLIDKRIDAFDKNYSRFRADSLVTKIAQQTGTYQLPKDAGPMLDLYHKLYELTDGQVTPLIGQLLSDAGYDASYSLKPGKLTAPPTWDEALSLQGQSLTTTRPVLLDFGAAGKGYLVDIIGELLEDQGYSSFTINAGGDILRRGVKPIKIGLEHPDNTELAVGIAKLSNQAICGSAGNRRAWSTYTHIMHPTSLTSPDRLKAVWVVADSTLLADGLSTALFFVPADQLKRYTFEYALVKRDNSLEHSPDFPATFFST